MKYCYVRNGDDKILETRDMPDGFSPTELNHKFGTDFDVRIIPLEIDTDPEYDPATQKVNTARTVLATEVRDKKNVVALTSEELAKIADNADRDAKIASVGRKVATLREWADIASETTVTTGNAVNILQQMVNNLGKFYDAFADLIEGQRIDK